MTERVRSQAQASEMRFLRRIEGATYLLTPFNEVRSSEIQKSLIIEPPLLLQIKDLSLDDFAM